MPVPQGPKGGNEALARPCGRIPFPGESLLKSFGLATGTPHKKYEISSAPNRESYAEKFHWLPLTIERKVDVSRKMLTPPQFERRSVAGLGGFADQRGHGCRTVGGAQLRRRHLPDHHISQRTVRPWHRSTEDRHRTERGHLHPELPVAGQH